MANKLTPEQWEEIRKGIEQEDSIVGLARLYGVSKEAVYAMAWRKKWLIKKKDMTFFKWIKRYLG